MTYAKKPRGRYYGENNTKMCSHCKKQWHWKLVVPLNGSYRTSYCKHCLPDAIARRQLKRKKEDECNFIFIKRYVDGYRGEGPYGSFFNAMLASLFRGWLQRMNSYGEWNNNIAINTLKKENMIE